MTNCQGTLKAECMWGTVAGTLFRVSVLDAGREKTGIYCRTHASCAVIRAAFGGQRVVVVRGQVQDPPTSISSVAFEIPTSPIMVSGDGNDEFAEADSRARR